MIKRRCDSAQTPQQHSELRSWRASCATIGHSDSFPAVVWSPQTLWIGTFSSESMHHWPCRAIHVVKKTVHWRHSLKARGLPGPGQEKVRRVFSAGQPKSSFPQNRMINHDKAWLKHVEKLSPTEHGAKSRQLDTSIWPDFFRLLAGQLR